MVDRLQEYRKECRCDPRSDAELIRIASTRLEDPDDEQYWAAIRVLHGRFGPEAFAQAQEWSQNPDAARRRAAADLLAQAHIGAPEFEEPAGDLLIQMLRKEGDPEVLNSLAIALGHNGHAGRVPLLAKLRRHPDDRVRYGVAYGLAGCDEPEAVEALIDLSADGDAEVRDWATFALGSQTELDEPAIREALYARASDSDEETQGEAILGLAIRSDPRVIPFIVEAAKEFPQVQFLVPLLQLKDELGEATAWRTALQDEAIHACTPPTVNEAPRPASPA
jgi:HEAT repeat protein